MGLRGYFDLKPPAFIGKGCLEHKTHKDNVIAMVEADAQVCCFVNLTAAVKHVGVATEHGLFSYKAKFAGQVVKVIEEFKVTFSRKG
jgi:hypothetical protein